MDVPSVNMLETDLFGIKLTYSRLYVKAKREKPKTG